MDSLPLGKEVWDNGVKKRKYGSGSFETMFHISTIVFKD